MKTDSKSMTAAKATIAFVDAELAVRQMVAPTGECSKQIVGDWERLICRGNGDGNSIRDFDAWCGNCRAHYFHGLDRRGATRQRRKLLNALIAAMEATRC